MQPPHQGDALGKLLPLPPFKAPRARTLFVTIATGLRVLLLVPLYFVAARQGWGPAAFVPTMFVVDLSGLYESVSAHTRPGCYSLGTEADSVCGCWSLRVQAFALELNALTCSIFVLGTLRGMHLPALKPPPSSFFVCKADLASFASPLLKSLPFNNTTGPTLPSRTAPGHFFLGL